jgi:hypothetical protein
MCLWFPAGDAVLEEDTYYLIKTFHSVFPDMSIWTSPHHLGIYLMGKMKPGNIDVNRIEKAFTNSKFLEDVTELDRMCDTPQKLLGMKTDIPPDTMKNILQNASLITDDYPFTEFPLWRYVKMRYLQSKQNQK